MKLNVKAFALTCGLVWGIGILLITWWIIAFNKGATGEVPFLGQIYRGYNISPLGSVIGLVWGLADGTIGGAIFAWVYNLLGARLPGAKQVSL